MNFLRGRNKMFELRAERWTDSLTFFTRRETLVSIITSSSEFIWSLNIRHKEVFFSNWWFVYISSSKQLMAATSNPSVHSLGTFLWISRLIWTFQVTFIRLKPQIYWNARLNKPHRKKSQKDLGEYENVLLLLGRQVNSRELDSYEVYSNKSAGSYYWIEPVWKHTDDVGIPSSGKLNSVNFTVIVWT